MTLLPGLLTVFVIVVSASLTAQREFVVYGIGQTSCGVWTAQAAKATARAEALSWVLGFVSGADAAAPAGAALKKTDSLAVEMWITQFCQQRPREMLSTAAAELVGTLRTP